MGTFDFFTPGREISQPRPLILESGEEGHTSFIAFKLINDNTYLHRLQDPYPLAVKISMHYLGLQFKLTVHRELGKVIKSLVTRDSHWGAGNEKLGAGRK